ncbi:MAG: SET domain-containing protein, partial [Phycisphaerales bacterium]|nr:SET domain-containing protein [Phycisphaerales bacterium]
NEQIGHGVVATRNIPKGTITWVQDKLDREFTSDHVESLGGAYLDILDKYCFRNQQGQWVLCWDHARFVNHSFNSNCLTTAYSFEVAIRDIRAGEEITDDYGYLNIREPFRALDEGAERKIVYPDDLTRYHAIWDEQLRQVWPCIPKTKQPLREFLSREVWRRVGSIAGGREEMGSILECYYEPDDMATARRSNAMENHKP